jgi:UDP-hydrolysing UDP-N-acetyl-D-glucosamine 2-epimerase
MGEDPDKVFHTGGPDIDLAATIAAEGADGFDPFEHYGGVGSRFPLDDGFLVVVQHPVTTEYAEAQGQVEETLYALHDFDLPSLWFWPNVDAGSDGMSKGIRAFREHLRPDNMHFFRSMAPEDFLRLLLRSKGIVGNSSAGIRECSFLGVPAVNIGDRQAGREHGRNVVFVDYARDQIAEAAARQASNGMYPGEQIYGDGRAGPRIADVLASCELTIEKRLRY